MFVFSVVLSVINLFFMDDHATCHRTLCSGLSRQRGYSTSRVSDVNPIENVWDSWEASCWSKLSSDIQEHPHPCTHRGMGKLPQQLLDNVVQSMGTTCGILHDIPRWTYPVLIPFLKVPADF
ncbi:hypothetical protein TNCV_3794871 [Trichonephila clavipes]|nr:hypothetical protein TNCV_3794871 [Trichonephila clavipes]